MNGRPRGTSVARGGDHAIALVLVHQRRFAVRAEHDEAGRAALAVHRAKRRAAAAPMSTPIAVVERRGNGREDAGQVHRSFYVTAGVRFS